MVESVLFGLAAFVSTFLGGQVALRYKRFINPLIAFCGGTLVAVALLDLLPEASELLRNIELFHVFAITLGSFMVFHFLDKLISIHGHSHSEECEEHNEEKSSLGLFAAAGLITHSFMDGLAIGTGFLVSETTGLLIASVVLIHDFADGINTVTLLLRNRHENKTAVLFLIADALVPLLGVIAAQFLKPSESILGVILAVFAGLFLYLGATDLLPEAHRDRSSVKLVLFTFLGVIVVAAFRLLVE